MKYDKKKIEEILRTNQFQIYEFFYSKHNNSQIFDYLNTLFPLGHLNLTQFTNKTIQLELFDFKFGSSNPWSDSKIILKKEHKK